MRYDFGIRTINGINDTDKAKYVLEQLMLNYKNLTSSDAQIYLRETYETVYGIRDHSGVDGEHPFALVLMNECENTVKYGPVRERMKQFIDKKINKYFGLNYTEFVSQPTYIIELQILEATDRMKAEMKEASAIESDLENEFKK